MSLQPVVVYFDGACEPMNPGGHMGYAWVALARDGSEVAHDADQAIGQATDDTLHWMVWNIPASARSLAEGMAQGNAANGPRQISAWSGSTRKPIDMTSTPKRVIGFIFLPSASAASGLPVRPKSLGMDGP